MSQNYCTLADLRNRVNSMIAELGENAPIAWWIYSSKDVVKFDDNGEEIYHSDQICREVLSKLDDYDHIYTEIAEAVDKELDQALQVSKAKN